MILTPMWPLLGSNHFCVLLEISKEALSSTMLIDLSMLGRFGLWTSHLTDGQTEVRLTRLFMVNSNPGIAMFSPQGYPNGKIMYDFSISLMDNEFSSLHDLEPWRQTFCVCSYRRHASQICSNVPRYLH